MPFALPLIPSEARYRVGTALDDVQYLLDVRWNGREGVWHMDILTEDEVVLQSSIALVLGVISLAWRNPDPRLPPGMLQVRDLSDNGEDAGFDDMGERVVVYYFPLSELSG